MASFTKVEISEALVIKALNTPSGSGGVWRWIEGVAQQTRRNAIKIAPVGNPLDSLHRPEPPGRYKKSFRIRRVGSNQHILVRQIINTAPHAIIVEKGRRSTRFDPSSKGGPWERFSWSKRGGKFGSYAGTSGRAGHHVVERSFERAMARRRTGILL
jgi:hypothetical protein